MKIPKELPQFKRKDALFIVSGKQDAVMYEAHNGVIDRLDSFRIPNPHYSDDEGSFRVRSGGKIVRSGYVKEVQDRDKIRDFIHELKERIKNFSSKLSHNFTNIYIFAPAQTKNIIPSALPAKWKHLVSMVVEGNYYYRDPVYLLKKIK